MLQLHHVAFRTSDLARLEGFYGAVLGLPVLRRSPGRSVWFGAGPIVIMIEQRAESEPTVAQGSLDLIAFRVGDRAHWRARLAATGIPIEHETEHTLYFRDPDGRRVGVSTYAFDAT